MATLEQQLSKHQRELITGFPFAGELPADRALPLIQPFSSQQPAIPDVLAEFVTDDLAVDVSTRVPFPFRPSQRIEATPTRDSFDPNAFFQEFLSGFDLQPISQPETTSPDAMDFLDSSPSTLCASKTPLSDKSARQRVHPMDVDSSPTKAYTPKSVLVVAQSHEKIPWLDQLEDLLQDIFHDEDALDSASQPKSVHFTPSGSLRPDSMLQVSKTIAQIVKSGAGPALVSRFSEAEQLERFLRILRRIVQTGADAQPISAEKLKAIKKQSVMAGESDSPAKGRKTPTKKVLSNKKKGAAEKDDFRMSSPSRPEAVRRSARSRSGSQSLTEPDDDDDLEDSPSKRKKLNKTPSRASTASSAADGEIEWLDEELDAIEAKLERIYDALLAVSCTFSLLSAARLPKQLYSEDFISLCFQFLRDRLTDTAFPFFESLTDQQAGHATLLDPLLQHGTVSYWVDKVLNAFSSTLLRVHDLVAAEEMSEHIVIIAVFIAVGPFFVEGGIQDADSKGKSKVTNTLSALKTLRMASLNLLRALFAKYPKQRHWIVDEILSMLSYLPDLKQKHFKLRNGRSVHTVSALLLHLIQSCAHGVSARIASKLAKIDQPPLADEDAQCPKVADVEERCQLCQREVAAAIESAAQTTNAIVSFVFSKSFSAKASETNYKALLETIVADALAVFDLPEWPASGFFLNICLRKMFEILASTKTTADASAAKTACLDVMGSIGAALTARRSELRQSSLQLVSLAQILATNRNENALVYLAEANQYLVRGLLAMKDEDATSKGAADFLSARWAFEITVGLRRIDEDEETSANSKMRVHLSQDLLDIWQPDFKLQETIDEEKTTLLAKHLGWEQNQKDLLEQLLSKLLLCLESSDSAAQRSRALKCLGQIVAEDADNFGREDVRLAIESRFRDAQSSVRDAALDLLGEYIVQRPDLAVSYLPRICERSTDMGLNVRKRAIKLLRRLFSVLPSQGDRVIIARTLFFRGKDDDTNVKDLAISALEDMLFTPPKLTGKNGETVDRFYESCSQVLMNVATDSHQRMPPVEEALKIIVAKRVDNTKASAELESMLLRLSAEFVTLLTEAPDLDDKYRVGCAKVLDILVQAKPSILSTYQIEALLPYLHSAERVHERAVRDLLLRIIRATLPFLPPAALPTTERLQLDLTQLLNKVPPNQQTLQELVACLCDVVTKHTHQFAKLCGIFKAIDKAMNDQLKMVKTLAENLEAKASSEPSDSQSQASIKQQKDRLATIERTSAALILVFGLLAQYSDFDALRATYESAVEPVNGLTTVSVSETAFNKLVVLYAQPEFLRLQTPILSSLGFLFKGFPVLMMRHESTSIMDSIFEDFSRKEARTRLLFLIQDFLSNQATKSSNESTETIKAKGQMSKRATPKKIQQDDLDINELIGNTDGFADSGVGSAIVQRYLHHVLGEATSRNSVNRNAALEIISFTVRLGLAHPVQCLPTIVALETSLDQSITKKAIALHASMYQKHAVLVSGKFIECAAAAFTYAQDVASSSLSHPRGYRQDDQSALLSPWYGLLKEKRPTRVDFVKTLAKSLAVDPGRACSAQDVGLARFIADNLACLDYKTQEEIFIVLKQIDRILGDSGMQTMQMIAEQVNKDAMVLDDQVAKTSIEDVSLQSLVFTALRLLLCMALRDHLKLIYNLSDAKCAKFVEGKKSAIGDKAPNKPDAFPVLDLGRNALLVATAIASTLSADEAMEYGRQFSEILENDASVLAKGPSDEEDDA